jgi:hypothetical protein
VLLLLLLLLLLLCPLLNKVLGFTLQLVTVEQRSCY